MTTFTTYGAQENTMKTMHGIPGCWIRRSTGAHNFALMVMDATSGAAVVYRTKAGQRRWMPWTEWVSTHAQCQTSTHAPDNA